MVQQAPVFMVNVQGNETRSLSTTYTNIAQGAVAKKVVNRILAMSPDTKVAVICLYNGQRYDLAEVYGNNPRVRVASVDSFQGSEEQYVVIVITRTIELQDNTFFNDEELQNVAFTRAQRDLVIMGKVASMRSSATWRPVIEKLHQTHAIFDEIPTAPTQTWHGEPMDTQ